MAFVRGMAPSSQTLGASYYADVNALDTIGYARDALNGDILYAPAEHPSTGKERGPTMSRFGRLFRNRIALALLGIAIVGGGGAYWAATSGAPNTHQAANSLTNEDPTSAASAEDPTATTTTDPGATATATTIHSTPTPRPTATPCLTPTPVPVGQSVHWQGRVVSVGGTSFVLRVGCGRPTIAVDSTTTWTATGIGAVTNFAALRVGANAAVDATSQGGGTYFASSVNAHNDN
jgi:hypothetical protein